MIKIFDGHNDYIKKAYLHKSDFFDKNSNLDISYYKMKNGNFLGGIFAVLSIPEKEAEREYGYGLKVNEQGWNVKYASEVSQVFASAFVENALHRFLKNIYSHSNVRVIKSFKDLRLSLKGNVISIIIHFEGAEPIKEDISNLDYYYELGLRSLGIVWSRPNVFGTGVPFIFPSTPDIGEGLSLAGKNLVRQCNNKGILLDLAHLNLKGFYDVASISVAPIVVSHAGVHDICSSSTNILDEQLSIIKQSNGVVGIIFDVLNIRSDGRLLKNTPIKLITDHIDYVVEKIGIQHVAFGSDFDGGQILEGINDASKYQNLVSILKQKGYKDSEIEQITYKNWMRVFKNTWK